jgi:hypothetical protein
MAKIQINEEVMMDYTAVERGSFAVKGGKIASCGSLSKHRRSQMSISTVGSVLCKAPVRLSH